MVVSKQSATNAGEKTKTFHADEYWITLDSYDWFNKSDVGTWNVSVAFKYYGYPPTKILSSGSGNTSFTMNTIPEPVSTLLFLSGGVVLLGRRLLKEKK